MPYESIPMELGMALPHCSRKKSDARQGLPERKQRIMAPMSALRAAPDWNCPGR